MKIKPRVSLLLLMVCFFTLQWMVGYSDALPEDHEILKRADEARGNLDGVIWEVSVASKENNRSNSIVYQVQARGFDIMATTLLPAKYKDDKVLMLNGNMWFHKPGLNKPFPISQRQKLTGNAAYGDIAATNYANDYYANLLGEEMIEGELCYVYDLKAKKRDCTYDQIKYWISKERSVGVKADYYTLSGKKFKSALMKYNNNVEFNGLDQAFISKITIFDEMMSNNITTLTFDKPVMQSIPDHVFNLNLMLK